MSPLNETELAWAIVSAARSLRNDTRAGDEAARREGEGESPDPSSEALYFSADIRLGVLFGLLDELDARFPSRD